MNKTIRLRTNLTFGIVAIVIGLIIIALIPGQILPNPLNKEYVDGKFIPYVMCGIMIGTGAISIFKSLVLKKEDIKELEVGMELRYLLFLLMIVVYYLLVSRVSFLLASLSFGIGSMVYLGCKSLKKYLVVCAVIILIAVIFKFGLNVRFGGIWGI